MSETGSDTREGSFDAGTREGSFGAGIREGSFSIGTSYGSFAAGYNRPPPALIESQVLGAFRSACLDIKVENQWFTALQRRDCKRLMLLLRQHPFLWLITGREERTVLHVAVIQGCAQLIKQVFEPHLVSNKSKRNEIDWKNLKKLLYAKDGKCKADVFCLAAIVGNEEVIEILDSTRISLRGGFGKSRAPEVRSSMGSLKVQISDGSHHIDIGSSADGPSVSNRNLEQQGSYHNEDEVNEFMGLLRSNLHKELQKRIRGDVDYNFDEARKGLVLHFACKYAYTFKDFIKSVVDEAKEKPGLLHKLFNLRDAQGRTPFHVATDFCMGLSELQGIKELLKLLPDECVNGRDGAGRTPLHRAVANGMDLQHSQIVQVLVNDKRTDLNAEWPGGSGATALHVAALHNHGASARFVLEAQRDDEAQRADVEKKMTRLIKVYKNHWYSTWTPLELAVVMGRYRVVLRLLHASGKDGRKSICDQRCLHLAAAAGDLRSIQALLMNRNGDLQHFDSDSHFGGYSSLHFAVYAKLPQQPLHLPKTRAIIDETFDRFLSFSDYAHVHWLQQELTISNREEKKGSRKVGMTAIGYGDKKTCVNLLLQAGVEIWPASKTSHTSSSRDLELDLDEDNSSSHAGGKDFHVTNNANGFQDIPDPGIDASDDARQWWYDRVAKETLEAKNGFNAAGNATAVVATLVATASFIGPLQPPLGYDSNADPAQVQVRVTKLAVRVFIGSNSLSFYLAIASIMLAIMPALPMPQEGLHEELHRSRRTVALAISVLLLSIIGILVSFTSSLIAVMPVDHFWALKFYPALVGGLVCLVVLFVFFLRLLRLVFSTNKRIKTFYRLVGKY